MCLSGQITDIKNEEKDEFIRNCQKAIEIIEMEEKLLNPTKTDETATAIEEIPEQLETEIPQNSLPEADITLNRQFLALYYLLNEADKELFGRNKSEIARFIQLLTGKNYDNIYKLTKNPIKDPSERTSKKYQLDIQFVKKSFLKLNLNKIAQQIENDNLIG